MASNLRVFIEFLGNTSGIESSLRQIDSFSKQAERSFENLERKIQKADQALAGLQRSFGIGFGVGLGLLGGVAKEGLEVAAMFERINLAIETMLGSKAEADKLMRQVVDFTKTTPFELKETAEATKQLLAFRASAEEIPGLLRTIGEAAAVMDVPISQAIRAMMQLRQGLFETQQLVPIGINRALLEDYGVKFETSGQLSSSGEEAFQAALKAMEDQFRWTVSHAPMKPSPA